MSDMQGARALARVDFVVAGTNAGVADLFGVSSDCRRERAILRPPVPGREPPRIDVVRLDGCVFGAYF